jgi:hypothetical protein
LPRWSPDFVTERIRKYADELGCNHLVLFWAVPMVTFEEYRQSLTLFADQVMPNFGCGAAAVYAPGAATAPITSRANASICRNAPVASGE